MLSRQASTKQLAPPVALTHTVSKGKERQQEPVAELARQTSTSSKGKERSRDFVKSVSPKKPGKHARGQALPLDAAELEARVKESLAEPLLPQGNKKTIVLTSDDSEYSTDEWSSDDNDEEVCLKKLVVYIRSVLIGILYRSFVVKKSRRIKRRRRRSNRC